MGRDCFFLRRRGDLSVVVETVGLELLEEGEGGAVAGQTHPTALLQEGQQLLRVRHDGGVVEVEGRVAVLEKHEEETPHGPDVGHDVGLPRGQCLRGHPQPVQLPHARRALLLSASGRRLTERKW